MRLAEVLDVRPSKVVKQKEDLLPKQRRAALADVGAPKVPIPYCLPGLRQLLDNVFSSQDAGA